MTEREKYPDGAWFSRPTAARASYVASALLLALFLPHVLVPLAVPAGTWCDLLVGGCQILLGIVFVVVVPREGLGWSNVVLVMLAVGSYWAIARFGVDFSILLVVVLGWLWINVAAPVPDSTRGCRPACDSSEAIQPATRAYLILLILVCVPVESIFLLWPIGPDAPMSEYATLLAVLVGVVATCVWLGLHVKEPGPHSTRGGRTICDSGETMQPGKGVRNLFSHSSRSDRDRSH